MPEERRISGAKFDYLPLSRRLDEVARRQTTQLPFLAPGNGKLRKRLEDPMFWRHVLRREHASVAATDAELDRGYLEAVTLAAADSADSRLRLPWPEPIRRFDGQEWVSEFIGSGHRSSPRSGGRSISRGFSVARSSGTEAIGADLVGWICAGGGSFAWQAMKMAWPIGRSVNHENHWAC